MLLKNKQNTISYLEVFRFSNKIYELKEIQRILPQNQINDLVVSKLKKMKELQNNV